MLSLGGDGCYLGGRDYNIVKELGAGGCSICDLGSDNRNGTKFVIKRSKNLFTEEEKRDMLRESLIMQEIDHENVIHFLGAVEESIVSDIGSVIYYHKPMNHKNHTFKMFLEYASETCKHI